MAVLDQFRLKVDSNDVYNTNETIKSLREIYTQWEVISTKQFGWLQPSKIENNGYNLTIFLLTYFMLK